MDRVVVPGGIVRAQVDTAVADVGVALRVDRPRRGMHVDAAVGDPLRVVSGDEISLRGIQWNTDGARVHHDAAIPVQDSEVADRRRPAGLAHGRGHLASDLAVDADREDVLRDAGDTHYRRTGGDVGGETARHHPDVTVRGPEAHGLPL